MDVKQILMLAFQVSIICIVFGFGLKALFADLLYLARRPGLTLRSLLSMLVIMPAVAIALAMMFEFRHTTEIVVVALAISPVPPLLPKREAKGGGRQSYGLALMALLALLAIVTVPLSAEILSRMFDRAFVASPAALARIVFIMMLLPLGAGIALRTLAPAVASRLERPVAVIGNVLLAGATVVLLAGTWRDLLSAMGEGAVAAMAVFVAAGLLAGHLLGGPDPEDAPVLALSTACRHPAIALSIASANFPDQQFAGTILLYVLVNAVVAVPYILWVRRQQPGRS
jgi:bile acid:Na+ symporter, BASS family